MSLKDWFQRLLLPVKKATWPTEVIEYPTDVHFVADGVTESITLKGNLFHCAWGMKGIRQANPDFIEEWLTTDDVSESMVVLRRPSTQVFDIFLPRGTKGLAQLIPDVVMLPSKQQPQGE